MSNPRILGFKIFPLHYIICSIGGIKMYSDETKLKVNKNKKSRKKRFFFFIRNDEERILSDTEKLYFKFLNSKITLSLIFIVLSIILYLTELSDNLVKVLLGILFMGDGILHAVSFFKKNIINYFSLNIIYGVIIFILGILSLFIGKTTIILGIWLIIHALKAIEYAIRFKLINEKSWNYMLMSGVLLIFIGILSIINPFVNLTEHALIASFLILYSLLEISDDFMLKKRSEYFMN